MCTEVVESQMELMRSEAQEKHSTESWQTLRDPKRQTP